MVVFGALSLVSPGLELHLAGTRLRLPRVAGLLLEKLVTDRTGEKGERDLLVALGLLMTAMPEDFDGSSCAACWPGRPRPTSCRPRVLVPFAGR